MQKRDILRIERETNTRRNDLRRAFNLRAGATKRKRKVARKDRLTKNKKLKTDCLCDAEWKHNKKTYKHCDAKTEDNEGKRWCKVSPDGQPGCEGWGYCEPSSSKKRKPHNGKKEKTDKPMKVDSIAWRALEFLVKEGKYSLALQAINRYALPKTTKSRIRSYLKDLVFNKSQEERDAKIDSYIRQRNKLVTEQNQKFSKQQKIRKKQQEQQDKHKYGQYFFDDSICYQGETDGRGYKIVSVQISGDAPYASYEIRLQPAEARKRSHFEDGGISCADLGWFDVDPAIKYDVEQSTRTLFPKLGPKGWYLEWTANKKKNRIYARFPGKFHEEYQKRSRVNREKFKDHIDIL